MRRVARVSTDVQLATCTQIHKPQTTNHKPQTTNRNPLPVAPEIWTFLFFQLACVFELICDFLLLRMSALDLRAFATMKTERQLPHCVAVITRCSCCACRFSMQH